MPFSLRLARMIVRRRKVIFTLFLLAFVLCALAATQVKTDYDLSRYVPKEAPSTKAMQLGLLIFDDAVPNLDVMTGPLELADVLAMKAKLLDLPFVSHVIWLDDQADVAQPLAFVPKDLRDAFYREGRALFSLTLLGDDYQSMIRQVREIVGEEAALRGNVISLSRANQSTSSEMSRIISFAVPLAFIILFIATKSWFEPFLFMLAIFGGVLLNMGTNVILGRISFITASVGAVLQLAVSMDYAIFLLSRFAQYREEGMASEEALVRAIQKSFSAITSSALTTVFGFLVLIFMRFRIGPDLGLVLAKGVFFSLLSVIFFLPTLILLSVKWIDRFSHRSFMPSFRRMSRLFSHLGLAVLIFALLFSIPAYLAQSRNYFTYGTGDYPPESREYQDNQAILEHFGRRMQLLLLLPTGHLEKEAALVEEIQALPSVSSVIGYAVSVGNQIPTELLAKEQLEQLRKQDWTRYILICQTAPESPETYQSAADIRRLALAAYPDAQLTGESPILLDMKETIQADNLIVNGLAILAVLLVLIVNFRSLSLPLILVYTIEFSIWLNLSVPYFSQAKLNYIGYLVISTIQLGATVDYAILLTQHYLDARKSQLPRPAARQAVQEALPAILPPALILAAVGYTLSFVSSMEIVSQLGLVLGRGTILSLLNVLLLLPGLLSYGDFFVRKLTYKLVLAEPNFGLSASSGVHEGGAQGRPPLRRLR